MIGCAGPPCAKVRKGCSNYKTLNPKPLTLNAQGPSAEALANAHDIADWLGIGIATWIQRWELPKGFGFRVWGLGLRFRV